MDKEEFIQSGLLEQYVLGLTSDEESEIVEYHLDLFPDLRQDMFLLQIGVASYAAQYAVPPPRHLKRKILSQIRSDESQEGETRATRLNPLLPFKISRVILVCLLIIAILIAGMLAWQRQHL